MSREREVWEQRFFASLQTLFPHETLENVNERIFGSYVVRFEHRSHPIVAVSATNLERVALIEKLFESTLDKDPEDVAATVATWLKERHGL